MEKSKPCYASFYKGDTPSNDFNNMEHKVWYTHYKSYIVKSWIHPITNRIIEEKIPYNQPNNYLKFLDNYNYSGKK
jgi:hypothetical protein